MAWVDVARGMAILLVAIYHGALSAIAVGATSDSWYVLNDLAAGFRMPVFFFVSGLLATSLLRRPWREVLRGRVALWLYLYLLWALATYAVANVVTNVRLEGFSRGWHPDLLLRGLVLAPNTGLWYLLALPIFLVLTRAVGRLPAPVLVLVACVLSAALLSWDDLREGGFAWRYTAACLPFYVLGTQVRALVQRRPPKASWAAAGTMTTVYLAVAVAIKALPGSGVRPGLSILVGALAVAAGIAVAVRLTGTRVGVRLERLGRTTLPVYLLHDLVIGLLVAVLLASVGLGPLQVLGPVLPVLLGLAGVAVALAVHRAVGDVPGIFRLPRRLEPRVRSTTPVGAALTADAR